MKEYLNRLKVIRRYDKLMKTPARWPDKYDLKEAGRTLFEAAVLLTLPVTILPILLWKWSYQFRVAARSEPPTKDVEEAIGIIERRRAREAREKTQL